MASEAIRYQPNYSATDYRTWEGEWELWNGVAVNMSPSPGFEHQNAATRLAARILHQLEQSKNGPCIVVTELDWQVSPDTVVRPDVSVLCKGHPGQFISYAPALIAEILSPSTEHKDRTAKRDLYQQQGVQFYLLVNPGTKDIEILSLQEDGRYQPVPVVNQQLSLTWGDDCRIDIPLSTIFSA